MKVCVYAICKNEERNVQAWLKNAAAADVIVLVDTGSWDGTAKIARKAARASKGKIIFHELSFKPFRFDDARNASLALLPADVDVCVPLDLDDRLNKGWRGSLEKHWVVGETTMGHFRYNFSYDANGNVKEWYVHSRIHPRHGYRWRFPCHEAPYPAGPMEEKRVLIEGLTMSHIGDNIKDRTFYMELLRTGLLENPTSARMHFYYARELVFAGDLNTAAGVLALYSKCPDKFPHEEAQALELLAHCIRNKR